MAAPNTNPTYYYIDGQNPDGTILGRTTGSLIAFYGTTPVAQNTGLATSAISAAETTNGVLTTRVTQIITALRNLGIVA
jgi:hypothetical protein